MTNISMKTWLVFYLNATKMATSLVILKDFLLIYFSCIRLIAPARCELATYMWRGN